MSGIFNAVLGATRKLVKTLSGASADEEVEPVVEQKTEYVRKRSYSKECVYLPIRN